MYQRLSQAFGHRNWWPGRTPLEVAVGAILTQNTAWSNVEQAIASLRGARALSFKGLRQIPLRRLETLIRPSGYFRQKARKLKAFVRFLDRQYAGAMARMARADLETLRIQLLGIWGIGPETADSILCYALHKPIFVVDAYTRRILSRHGYLPPDASYEAIQRYCMARLPQDVTLFNDFHAQFVHLGKDFCNTQPKCEDCPLMDYPLGSSHK